MAEQVILALYIVDEQSTNTENASDAEQSSYRKTNNTTACIDGNEQSFPVADKGHQWTNTLCGLRTLAKTRFDSDPSPVTSPATRPPSRLEQILISEVRQSITSGNLTEVAQALRTVADYPDAARRVLSAVRSVYMEESGRAVDAGIRVGFVETVDQDKHYSLTLRIGSVEVDATSGEKSATVITISSKGVRCAQRWSGTSGAGAAVETIDPAMAFRRLLAMSSLE